MFKFLLEHDINPVIVFDNNKKIKYFNKAADLLLSFVNKNEIFDFLAKNLKGELITEFKRIKFNEFVFYGYTLAVVDFDYLAVRFFIDLSFHYENIQQNANLEKINILNLMEFLREYFELKGIKLDVYYDPSIPEFFIDKKSLLNVIFEIVDNFDSEVEIKIDIGEYIKIGNKKCQIVEIVIINENPKTISSSIFDVVKVENKFIIKIPLILNI